MTMSSTKFVQTMELFLQNPHLFDSAETIPQNNRWQDTVNSVSQAPTSQPAGLVSEHPTTIAETFQQALTKPIKQKKLYTSYAKISELRYISVGFASSQTVRRWAEKILPNGKILGEVTSANTLHHKTFKPLKGGLFCERIFGPLRDFECACGIRKRPSQEEYQKIIEHRETNRKFCPTCDVEYTWSIIRRYQMGYIQLVSPVTHIWYLKANPSYLSILLDIKRTQLENVVYCSETLTLENSAKVVQNFSLSTSPSDLFLSWQDLLKSEKQATSVNREKHISVNSIKRKLEEEKRSNLTNIKQTSQPSFLEQNSQKSNDSSFNLCNSIQSVNSILSGQIQTNWKWFYHTAYKRAQTKAAQMSKRLLDSLQHSNEEDLKPITVLLTPNFSATFIRSLKQSLTPDFFESRSLWEILNGLQKLEFENWTLTKDKKLLLEILTNSQVENTMARIAAGLPQKNVKTVRSLHQRSLTSTSIQQVSLPLIQAIQLAFQQIIASALTNENRFSQELLTDQLSQEDFNKVTELLEILSNQLSLSLVKKRLQKDVASNDTTRLFVVRHQFLEKEQSLQQKFVSMETAEQIEDSIKLLKEQQKFNVFLNQTQKINGALTSDEGVQKVLYQNYLVNAGNKTASPLNGSTNNEQRCCIVRCNAVVSSDETVFKQSQKMQHVNTLFNEKVHFVPTQKLSNSTFIHKHPSAEFSSTNQGFRKFAKNIFHWNYGYLFSTLPLRNVSEKSSVTKNVGFNYRQSTLNPLKIDLLGTGYRTRSGRPVDRFPASADRQLGENSKTKEITVCKKLIDLQADPKKFTIKEQSNLGPNLSRTAQQHRKHRSLYSYLSFFKKKRKSAKNHLYSVSYRESWTHEKNWQYFSYYSLAPRYFEDVQVPIYQLRGLSSDDNDAAQSSVAGAGVLKTLLMEFYPKELRKMDKQNRIFLYEFSKKINTLKAFAKKGFAAKAEIKELKELCKKRDQLIRKTKLIRKLFLKNSNPTSMILSTLPVLPPDLRPILKMQDQIAASDLNRLYQRVIYRNDRLRKFRKDLSLSYGSNSFELKYAQRLLQEAVDNLIQNGKGGVTPERDSRGRALKSLSEILKGKQGRFRQYLLGKRVDYSGRSVIVVGPKLKIHECGLPREIAIELFLPFLIKRILHSNFARTVIGAKTLIKTNASLASFLLAELMQSHPILLNRAPTLHRLGIQAFQPKLVDGRAILLHPLVCPAFNADFDGDQMAVHVPLTVEARAEAWKLMFARNHLISAATGDPIMLPSQDMVLGCYYLTTEVLKYQKAVRPAGTISMLPTIQIASLDQSRIGLKSQKNYALGMKTLFSAYLADQQKAQRNKTNGPYFNSFDQVINAYDRQKLTIHSDIWVKWSNPVETISGKASVTQHEPLELRISLDGSWQEIRLKQFRRFESTTQNPDLTESANKVVQSLDRTNNRRSQYIRTTPGRVLFYNFIQNELKK